MSFLESLAHIAGFLGFLLSLGLWLANFVPFSVRKAQISYHSATNDSAMVFFVSVVICNRSARPLSILEVSLQSAAPSAKRESKTYPTASPNKSRQWLSDSRAPFEELSTFPVVLPPYSSQRICLSCYTRSTDEFLSAVQDMDKAVRGGFFESPKHLPPLDPRSTFSVPIRLLVSTTSINCRSRTISANYVLRP